MKKIDEKEKNKKRNQLNTEEDIDDDPELEFMK